MTTLLFAVLLAASPVESHYTDMECIGPGGGTMSGALTIKDDIKLCLGDSTCDWWLEYNSSGRFELWHTDCDGGGTDCEVIIGADGGDDLAMSGALTASDGVNVDADNKNVTVGAAGATDYKLYFDATDARYYTSGSHRFDAPVIVGSLEGTADSGLLTMMNQENVSLANDAEFGHVIAVNSTNLMTISCFSDGSAGGDDCHVELDHAPVYVPSSDEALAADAAFDCDEGLNRIAGSGGAVTLSASPSINDGDHDGQMCYVQGTDDTNTVTINDNTNAQLAGGTAFTAGKGDTIVLIWDSGDGDWYEISRSDN